MTDKSYTKSQLLDALSHRATHAGKYTYPTAQCNIYVKPKGAPDGFLRSGNVKNIPDDYSGNGSFIGRYRLLASMDSKELNTLLGEQPQPQATQTNDDLKQIYIPASPKQEYIATVLTPSGIVAKLNKVKKVIEKNGLILPGIARLMIGGSKPHNVGLLNSTFGEGNYPVLNSTPPQFETHVRKPRKNFFSDIMHKDSCATLFKPYQKTFLTKYADDMPSEQKSHMRKYVHFLICQFVEIATVKAWRIRNLDPNWSDSSLHDALPEHHKRWLDSAYNDNLSLADIDEIVTEMALTFIRRFRKFCGNSPVRLYDDFTAYVKQTVDDNFEDKI